MTAREGDQGTWSHCGDSKPHAPHMHTFAMNEGPYTVQCNGTAEERAYSHTELKAMLEGRAVNGSGKNLTEAIARILAPVSTPPQAEMDELLGETPAMEETYLIVRITHERDEHTLPTRISTVARVRQALHDVAEEYSLAVGDIVFYDRRRSSLPPSVQDATIASYPLVKATYDDIHEAMRPHIELKKRRSVSFRTDTEKIQHQAMGRARRALTVIEWYIGKYGEEGLRYTPGGRRKGRHAEGVPLLTGDELQTHIESLTYLPQHCDVTMRLIYTSDGPTLQCPECKREWKAVHERR